MDYNKRGTLGGSGYRNTAKKFSKYRNTAKKFGKYRNTAKKWPNTATPQYRVETRCNPEISTLYVKLSANNIEITIKSWLMNVKLGSFPFRQNQRA